MKKIALLKCHDCGEVLNTSNPFEEKDEGKVRITSGLAAGPCPKGCRSTFGDMNLNTLLEIQDWAEPSPADKDET